MAKLQREDGVQFVIQPYRELIEADKKSLLASKVEFRAGQQGEQLCILRKAAACFEVAFSKETGYLLGECVRHHFSKIKSFIYCEAKTGSSQFVLVVVRDGDILLDTVVPATQVQTELLPFLIDAHYDVLVYGDVPLSETEAPGKVNLPAETVGTFKVLPHSVLDSLKPVAQYQLRGINQALKTVKFKSNSSTQRWTLAVILFVLVFVMWLMLKPSATPVAKPVVRKPDIYATYNQAMMSPAPEQVLVDLTKRLEDFFFAPGWTLSSLSYKSGRYVAHYKSSTGSVELLNKWADHNNFAFTLLSDRGPEVTANSHLNGRSRPKDVYKLQQVVELLIDEMDLVLNGKSVTLGRTLGHGQLKEIAISLRLNSVSPDVLLLVGQRLHNLPVAINEVNLSSIKDGLLNGTIKLSVWGS